MRNALRPLALNVRRENIFSKFIQKSYELGRKVWNSLVCPEAAFNVLVTKREESRGTICETGLAVERTDLQSQEDDK